jgi:hypothetical protein
LAADLPQSGAAVEAALDRRIEAIRQSELWKELSRVNWTISHNPLLRNELADLRHQFEQEHARIAASGLPRADRYVADERFARRLYRNRGPHITAYWALFLNFARLFSQIYWLITQLGMKGVISCLSTGSRGQLQQVNFYHQADLSLTALTPTFAQTQRAGQLVHITFPEADHTPDGLYQIDVMWLRYRPWTGGIFSLKADLLAHAQRPELEATLGASYSEVFISSEEHPADEWRESISILDEDGTEMLVPRESYDSISPMQIPL